MMLPISYIGKIQKSSPDSLPYHWSTFQDAPFTPMKKPLHELRIGLISSGGLYHKDQLAFNPIKNDLTFREIPPDVNSGDLRISHNYYNSTDAKRDVNCVFPIERLKELEGEGFIGALVAPAYSFMGRIFKRTALQDEMVPTLLRKLEGTKVDALFLVPC